MALTDKLVAIADAIREKTGKTEEITLDQMVVEIEDIQTGVELPELTTPASEAEVFENKQYITQSGEIGTGTFTLASEISTQDALIAEILSALENKAVGSGDITIEGCPKGYVPARYIQFDDAQIVDTGIVCTQDTKIKVVFTRDVDIAMYLYGVTSDGNTASVTAYLSSGGSWRFGNKSASRAITVNEDLIHTAIVSNTGIVAVNPNNSFSDVSEFETIGSLLIGTVRNSDGTVAAAQYIGKIFEFNMWQEDELILKLLPVVSVDGETYRFWDSISGSFFDSITDVALKGGTL